MNIEIKSNSVSSFITNTFYSQNLKMGLVYLALLALGVVVFTLQLISDAGTSVFAPSTAIGTLILAAITAGVYYLLYKEDRKNRSRIVLDLDTRVATFGARQAQIPDRIVYFFTEGNRSLRNWLFRDDHYTLYFPDIKYKLALDSQSFSSFKDSLYLTPVKLVQSIES